MSVNGADPTYVESELVDAWVRVRIKDYHGLPRSSPASSSYFDHPQHTSDRYSIAYSFVPKQDMSGSDLVMGFRRAIFIRARAFEFLRFQDWGPDQRSASKRSTRKSQPRNRQRNRRRCIRKRQGSSQSFVYAFEVEKEAEALS